MAIGYKKYFLSHTHTLKTRFSPTHTSCTHKKADVHKKRTRFIWVSSFFMRLKLENCKLADSFFGKLTVLNRYRLGA